MSVRPEDIAIVRFGPGEDHPAPVDVPCAFCREPMAEDSVGEMAVAGETVISARHRGCRLPARLAWP